MWKYTALVRTITKWWNLHVSVYGSCTEGSFGKGTSIQYMCEYDRIIPYPLVSILCWIWATKIHEPCIIKLYFARYYIITDVVVFVDLYENKNCYHRKACQFYYHTTNIRPQVSVVCNCKETIEHAETKDGRTKDIVADAAGSVETLNVKHTYTKTARSQRISSKNG